jgi:tetratricopeptide (TPR) repeat protein
MARGDLGLSDKMHRNVRDFAQCFEDERNSKASRKIPRVDMRRLKAAALHGLGSLQVDSNTSLKFFRDARKIREISDRSRLAGTIMRIGSCCADRGRFSEAERYFKEAISVSHQWCDAETEASACRLLCRLAIDHRNPAHNLARARQYAEKALEVARLVPWKAATREATYASADCEYVAGQLDVAYRLYKKALGQSSERIWDECRCLLSLALLSAHRGPRNLSRADKWCEQANALLKSGADPRLRDRVGLVDVYLKSLRAKSGAALAYEELRRSEFPWLPVAPSWVQKLK